MTTELQESRPEQVLAVPAARQDTPELRGLVPAYNVPYYEQWLGPWAILSGQIIVPVKNDTKPEDQEVFYVNLSRANNATLEENQATGTIRDDDGLPLRLAALPGRRNAAGTLTAEQLAAVTDEAIRRWASAVGDQAAADLSGVNWELADLSGNLLGLAADGTVWIDRDAAGRGWFADASPWDDAEFLPARGCEELRARRGSPAADRADLLTAVMHELGHVLGLPDVSVTERGTTCQSAPSHDRLPPVLSHALPLVLEGLCSRHLSSPPVVT